MKKVIENIRTDEERAFYNLSNALVKNVSIHGPQDGESAFKECSDIELENIYFNLRYPLWHVYGCVINKVEMTDKARAALWYCSNVVIGDSNLHGIKALRECTDVKINKCDIISNEFGWKCSNLEIDSSKLEGEYLFFDSENIKIKDFSLKGKYSFQYVKNLVIEDSYLDTKDAFWHADNVVVRNSTIKGEYLGWYSKNLTLINCKIVGTQPLCYCENLVLENCVMENCDLSFENSEVNGNILGFVESIKNPKKGTLYVEEVGSIIRDDEKYGCKGEIIVG